MKKFLFLCTITAGILLNQGILFAAINWEDPNLQNTTIKIVHITQLRTEINAKLAQCGLPLVTGESLQTGVTNVRAIHVQQLRDALKSIAAKAPWRAAPTFSDQDPIVAGVTPIRSVHITELRTATENATCCGDGVCNGPESKISGNCIADCP